MTAWAGVIAWGVVAVAREGLGILARSVTLRAPGAVEVALGEAGEAVGPPWMVVAAGGVWTEELRGSAKGAAEVMVTVVPAEVMVTVVPARVEVGGAIWTEIAAGVVGASATVVGASATAVGVGVVEGCPVATRGGGGVAE